MKGRRLPLTTAPSAALQLPTIMDRGLAAKHGAVYVQLAAFAIDVDRIYALDPEAPALPLGWEVFLTECYVLGRIDGADVQQLALLEEVCLSILEQPPAEQGYGSQLLFAVYDAIDRGVYPEILRGLFRSWGARPKRLQKSLAVMWVAPTTVLASCAQYALEQAPTPPLAPPTREALAQMASEGWPIESGGQDNRHTCK